MAVQVTDTSINHHPGNVIPGCGFAANSTPSDVILPGITAGRPQSVFPEGDAGAPGLSGWIAGATDLERRKGDAIACRLSPLAAA